MPKKRQQREDRSGLYYHVERGVPVLFARRDGGRVEKGSSTFFVWHVESFFHPQRHSPTQFAEGSPERQLAENGTLCGYQLEYAGYPEYKSVWARMWALKPFEV